jgi:hypothetical protein
MPDILLCQKQEIPTASCRNLPAGSFHLLTGNTVHFTGSAIMRRPDLPSLRKPESISVSKREIAPDFMPYILAMKSVFYGTIK